MSIKNKLNGFLRKFNVELHGLGYLQALSKGDFKSNEIQVMKKYFNNNEIIIYDIGSNQGLTVKEFLSVFPNSSIHAFEPYLPYLEIITNKFAPYKNVYLNKEGISDNEGVLTFNINKGIDTSSFFASKKTGLNSDAQAKTIERVNLPVTTIQAYAKKYKHEKINILKLDVQGSELNALKGAWELLRDKKIDIIYTEHILYSSMKINLSFLR